MKGKNKRKLVLSRETVANLQEGDLKKVVAGGAVVSNRCPSIDEFYYEDTHCLC